MLKVSVLVSTYNDEKYIARCIRSLQNQNLNPNKYEIIVINDGSTDKTKFALDVLKRKNDDQLNIVHNKINLGLPASINIGINQAKGQYIVRVDADDFVNVNFLSALSFYLDMYSNEDAVECDYVLVDENESIVEIVNCNESPIACGIMFRKDRLVDVGMYDSNFRCNEEKDLRIRFMKKYQIGRLNLPLYRYRRHSTNMTNNKRLINTYDKLLEFKYKNI